jgi:polyhydroxyalkanoate synthase subunit PhaC
VNVLERQALRARNGLKYLADGYRPTVAPTPRDLIWKRDKARLWRYRGAPSADRPLLIVHSLVSKSYILDLQRANSMIGFLLDEGFDVYLLDWEPADAADAENTLETYVDDYTMSAIGAIGADAVTVVGYCFGGVLTLLLAAAHPELRLHGLVTLTTPCDYREMGFMSKMFYAGRLDPEDVIDDTGLVPAAAMDEGFQALKPTDRLVQAATVWQNLWNDDWIPGYIAMNRWARDQVPFPGAAFRQTVQVLIRDNALNAGVIPFGRGEVRLKDIRVPYLNVFCEHDTIVPAPSSAPLKELVGSRDAQELRLKSGHVGLVAGRSAAKVARPKIAAWIHEHQAGGRTGARRRKAPAGA